MFQLITPLTWVGIICLFFTSNIYAQKNYNQGYIISLSGDTIPGFIDNRNWDRNPTAIDFKESKDAEVQKYTSRQIAGFKIMNGDFYRSAVVQVDKTPTQPEKLSVYSKPLIVTDTVFLLEQVQGAISLYYLYDENNKSHFFVQKDEELMEELIQRNYITYKNNQPLLGTFNQYKDQLTYTYLTECIQLQPLIAKTAYTRIALISLLQKYNACLNPDKTLDLKSEDRLNCKFGLVAGLSLSSYKFVSGRYLDLNATKFSWQPNFTAGVSFQILLPRNRQKWSIYNEFSWKSNTNQGRYSYYLLNSKQSGTVTIKTRAVNATAMLRHSWVNKNWRPYANAGIYFDRSLQVSNRVQNQVVGSIPLQTRDEYILTDPDKFQWGVVGGVGVTIKKIMAEIRLESGNTYFYRYDLEDLQRNLVFLLGYSFN